MRKEKPLEVLQKKMRAIKRAQAARGTVGPRTRPQTAAAAAENKGAGKGSGEGAGAEAASKRGEKQEKQAKQAAAQREKRDAGRRRRKARAKRRRDEALEKLFAVPAWAKAPEAGEFKLEVLKGGCIVDEVKLEGASSFVIGRDAELCDVALANPSVSRIHLVLQFSEERRVFLFDVGRPVFLAVVATACSCCCRGHCNHLHAAVVVAIVTTAAATAVAIAARTALW